MTGTHAPAVACPHPGMIDPVIPVSAGGPAARDPYMAAADPVPVSAHPDLPCIRRGTGNFHAYRRRRDHDDAPDVVTLIRDHHAGWQRQRDDEAENSSCD